MVDRRLSRLERALQADRRGDVPGERDTVFVRRRVDRVEAFGIEARVQLEEVVAGRRLGGDHRARDLGVRHRVAVQ